MNKQNSKTITVGIPCYNEELTIKKVIDDFKKELPQAEILVVDNNSSDETALIAQKAGAKVVVEKRQGKGFAVQKIFNECKSDVLILTDGDDTYPANEVKNIIEPILNEEAEMVVGNRLNKKNPNSFSMSHWLGNIFLTGCFNFIFCQKLKDMESGFRAIDKKFVDSSALLAGGFGIEPELTIQAIEKGMRIREIPISLGVRPRGSESKLNTIKDGTIVLYTVVSLFRDYKPLQFFFWIALFFMIAGILLGWRSLDGYFETGILDRIPTLIIACFCAMFGFISGIAGLILSSIKRHHEELLIILNRRK